MADRTSIEWTDATVNAVNGCSVISPGCTNCYAMRAGSRNLPGYPSTGLTMPSKGGHVWTGEVLLNEKQLLQPLKWKRPRRIFWNAHGDLFHDNVPDEWIDRVFAVCALTPQHTHMILTKRAQRMREWTNSLGLLHRLLMEMDEMPGEKLPWISHWPLPNVWLGVSVEDQTRADERIPDLLATPAAVRFLSCEPLLGPVDLMKSHYQHAKTVWLDSIDWVIVGGESGPGARPMYPDWPRSLRDQCEEAGVPFFMKQLSSGGPRAIKDMNQFPEDLRIREMPNAG